MIITTLQELRLSAPAHALDSIDGLVGFIDNSEHDFLADKLGQPLYDRLCQWYDEHPNDRSTVDAATVADGSVAGISYYNRLLLMCQRCVAFDALGAAAGMQMVSVNNAGINQMSAEDYPKADPSAVTTYQQTCTREAHKALNRLLQTLEHWCTVPGGSAAASPSGTVPGGSAADVDPDLTEIVTLWRHSRYYYLAASLLIPSALVLQEYVNIYDSREKFIQMLPDLQFIQEEQIAPAIGDELTAYLVSTAVNGTLPPADPDADRAAALRVLGAAATDEQIAALLVKYQPSLTTVQLFIRRLRKVMAALLVERTSVIKFTKEQRVQAHDDGVRMLSTAVTYLRNHLTALPLSVALTSPLYDPALTAAPGASPSGSPTAPGTSTQGCECCASGTSPQSNEPTSVNNRPGTAAFFTDPLL